MNNYIMLDGVKIELTEEQIKTIRSVSEKKKSPFDRVKDGEEYFIIVEDFKIIKSVEHYDEREDKRVACANYCTDKKLLEQRALHEKLSRLLWRFGKQNDNEENVRRWMVGFSPDIKACDALYSYDTPVEASCFSTEELANKAIEEIVKPFIAEHPEFRWEY